MTGPIIAHLDMDSFYASVEVHDNPELIGRPVIIGGDPKLGRGVVSTCSYEAREYGVHSAMPILRAYERCPNAFFIKPRMTRYVTISEKIMEEIRSILSDIEQVSIDEAYMDLTHTGSYEQAELLARQIKMLIKKQNGLTCSIGIGPARSYAKIASDLQKPDGLVVIDPKTLPDIIFPLPVRKIQGIGKKADHALEARGIRTIGDIAKTDIQILQEIFGSQAVPIKLIACGEDRSGLHYSRQRRSISREKTYSVDISDEQILLSTISRLCSSVHQDLVSQQMQCKTLTLKIRYTGFQTKNHSISWPHPRSDLYTIEKSSSSLFSLHWEGAPVRLIGIRLSGLISRDRVQTRISDFISSGDIP